MPSIILDSKNTSMNQRSKASTLMQQTGYWGRQPLNERMLNKDQSSIKANGSNVEMEIGAVHQMR